MTSKRGLSRIIKFFVTVLLSIKIKPQPTVPSFMVIKYTSLIELSLVDLAYSTL